MAPETVLAISTLEFTLNNKSKPDKFLHLTRCPNITMYYAQYNNHDNKNTNIAQIDSSFSGLSFDVMISQQVLGAIVIILSQGTLPSLIKLLL